MRFGGVLLLSLLGAVLSIPTYGLLLPTPSPSMSDHSLIFSSDASSGYHHLIPHSQRPLQALQLPQPAEECRSRWSHEWSILFLNSFLNSLLSSDCWWGLVEQQEKQYNFSPYAQLTQMVADAGLKMEFVLSFHRCGKCSAMSNEAMF